MDELIEKYIDRGAFESDTQFALDQLKKLEGEYSKLREFRVDLAEASGIKNISGIATSATESIKGLGTQIAATTATVKAASQTNSAYNSSLQANIKNLNDYKAALKANGELQKQASKDVEAGTITADQYRFKITALTEAQFKLKQQISDTTKEIKSQTQLQFAAPTSKLEARTQNAQLTRQVENTPTTDTAKIKELNDLIDRNNKLIDDNSDKLSKQKINVGNYGPSVKAALSVIEDELTKINAALANTEKGTKAFDDLTQKATLLKEVSKGLTTTVTNIGSSGTNTSTTSTKLELRALQEAAKKLGTEFGVTNTAFTKFADVVGERKDQLEDIQKAINFKSSDTKGLDAVVAGVQLVVGAYGAYQAAVALTGVENEELQKSMQKLQAVLTLVTSVQAIANSLQSESALIQGLLAAKASLLAVAERAAAIATGQNSAALTAETAAAAAAAEAVTVLAEAEAAAVAGGAGIAATSEAAAVGLGSEAVAAGALAEGLGTVAVAEGAVAAGATAAATAIAATGIGLIVIGLAIAIYKIVDAIIDWSKANESSISANKALTASLKDLIDSTKEYETIRKLATNAQIADMQRLADLRKAEGITAAQGLALDKQIATAKLKSANEDAKRYNVTAASLKNAADAAKLDADVVRISEQNKQKYIQQTTTLQDKDYEDKIKVFDSNIELRKKDAAASKAALDFALDISARQTDAQQQIAVIGAQAAKMAADDRRQFILESARIESEISTSKNNKILNDEKSTLKERLDALKDNFAQQRAVFSAENAAIQSDPTQSSTQKAIAAKKAATEISIAQRESLVAAEKLREDFRLRDLAAETDINKKIFDQIANTNESILNNDILTEQQRLEALQKFSAAKQAITEADFNQQLSTANISDADIKRIKETGFFEIANKKITDEELLKLISDYNASQLVLAQDVTAKRIEITNRFYANAKAQEKALRDIQRAADLQGEDKTDTYNNEVISLNERYKKKLLTTVQYNAERKKLDSQLAKDLLLIESDRLEKSLAAEVEANKATIARLQAERDALKNFTGPQDDNEKKAAADRLKRIDDELKMVEDAVGKETELYKALSKARKDLSDQGKGDDDTAFEEFTAKIEDLKGKVNEVTNVLSGAFNAFATAQKNKIQEQSDALDAQTAAEIDAVNASVLSEQDKAAKIAIINAKAATQKAKLAAEQRKVDEDTARAQKAFSIFQIILNTAVAIAESLKNPLKIPFIAALGAAELAVAIATPIPKFKTGKTSTYEGPGEVNDGPDQEYIYRAADGTIEAPRGKNVLTHVGKYDIIYPNYNAMMRAVAMPQVMSVSSNGALEFSDLGDRLESAIERQTPLLREISNKRENHLSAKDGALVSLWKHGANTSRYLDENTNW